MYATSFCREILPSDRDAPRNPSRPPMVRGCFRNDATYPQVSESLGGPVPAMPLKSKHFHFWEQILSTLRKNIKK